MESESDLWILDQWCHIVCVKRYEYEAKSDDAWFTGDMQYGLPIFNGF